MVYEHGERVQDVSSKSMPLGKLFLILMSFETEFFFFSEVSSACSFGEMLFLIAIHFHSNNMSAISDLVYLTLGLKVISPLC